MAFSSPYFQSRFLINGIVEKLVANIADMPAGTKIYVEKDGKLEPPFIHIHVVSLKTKRIKTFEMQYTFFVQFICRLQQSTTDYADLEDFQWAVMDAIQTIELPMETNPKLEGPSLSSKKMPVLGYDIQSNISRVDDYADANVYARYRLIGFRQRTIEPKQKTIVIKENLKGGEE